VVPSLEAHLALGCSAGGRVKITNLYFEHFSTCNFEHSTIPAVIRQILWGLYELYTWENDVGIFLRATTQVQSAKYQKPKFIDGHTIANVLG
jgi:hypothetical protein